MQDKEGMRKNNIQEGLDSMNPHQFSDHELVAAFIEKRLTDNLAAFKNYLPDIYECFKDYQEERFYLIYDYLGNINIFDRDGEKLLYENNPVKQCYNNLEKYKYGPIQRPFFLANSAGQDDVNYLHSSFLNELSDSQREILKHVVSGQIDRVKNSEVHHRALLPETVNTLFLMSTGLGFDLEKLYSEFIIRHLVLVEPSEDLFYISMQLVDWAGILKKSIDEGLKLYFIIGGDVVQGISDNVSLIGRHNTSGAYFYSGFYLADYMDVFVKVKDNIAYSYLSGFGFYDDSRYSLAHSLGNVSNDVPLLSTDRSKKKAFGQEIHPVFVIGNGPSLDSDIAFLKDNQDKAVIISCGSSLKALLVNDIFPDFYVELERTSIVTYFINKTSEGIDDYYDKIKKIKFIAASQVDPVAFSFFDKAGAVLKDIETGSMFLNKHITDASIPLLPRLAPTCVHMGVSIATILGYRDIYLFGTDMGTLNVDQHHSKYSLYANATKEASKKLEIRSDSEVLKSNFGDKKVYSSGMYPVFKRELESIISGWQQNLSNRVRYYNCSDGAYIEGAEPIRSSDIIFKEEVYCEDVKHTADLVFDAYFSFYPKSEYSSLLDSLEQVKKSVCHACDWAIDVIHPVDSIRAGHEIVDVFGAEFHSDKVLSDEDSWIYSVFDGSLLYSLSMINSSLQLPVSEELVVAEINKQFSSLKRFFEDLKEDFSKNCLEWDKEERHAKFLGEDKEPDEPKSGEVS